LWREALETTVPAMFTGSKIATGVITPVLPICRSIFFIIVVFCSAGNLRAIANLGAFPV
jgi:hypothetical protein